MTYIHCIYYRSSRWSVEFYGSPVRVWASETPST